MKQLQCLLFMTIIFIFASVVKSSEFELKDEDDEHSWLNDEDDRVNMVQSHHSSRSKCQLSAGKWVYDQSYPLYDSTCPYLSTAVTCQKNGRPDSDYEKWRWKPNRCSIPRFDALKFLGKMRRKRIMLMGDSIMRNQWESLVCLVQGVVPTARKRVTYNGPSMAFHAMDFEVSIEFTWAPLLVELNKGAANKRILHLDLIEENAKYWRGVDVLVFDSAHWWTHSDKTSSHQHVPEPLLVLQGVLRKMSFPVYLQDITTISAFRRDGHPSVYRRAMGQEEKQHLREYSSDCSHWCLPGVPDIWNEMLSALL
ncbi:hypothetical protein ACLB2K_073558 [Fragaria x ananassa]